MSPPEIFVALLQLSWSLFAVAQSSNTTVRSYFFDLKTHYLPLSSTLPQQTSVYKVRPKEKLRTDFPEYLPVVGVQKGDDTIVGPPIHVVAGENLKLTVKNEVPFSGTSIHFHGFEFGGAFEYDGAVGVAQCPLSEGNSFVYDIVVHESPGTYWYHTEAGHLGVDAYDAVRGPLIVHSKGAEGKELVDSILQFPGNAQLSFAYGNERILFFQDVFLTSRSRRYSRQLGNLDAPVSKTDEGLVAAMSPWEFGTCNGKLRDVVHVVSDRKYKFRLINGGSHHALRISIEGFPLTVVAADSEPVEAYTVDEVILHVGERFDVEVYIYSDLNEGERFWIRADTLESGFENGIRAVLRVSERQPSSIKDVDVADPFGSIITNRATEKDLKMLNCYNTDKDSGCIPITALSALKGMGTSTNEVQVVDSEIHTVDTDFLPAPLFGHFVSVDGSHFIQNELPLAAMISRGFRPKTSIHPHSVVLALSRSSSIIIVWRTTLLMDQPIHLHGHKVEILDVALKQKKDCTLRRCKLSPAYDSREKLEALDKSVQDAVKKDTFVIPGGGAVVVRFQTHDRGLWLASGQVDIHADDGLSFVMNVGDYRIPGLDSWLPNDFPSCNSTFVKSISLEPSCECYNDLDSSLGLDTSRRHFCSRKHLCRHVMSQAANLDAYKYETGLKIRSAWKWEIPEALVTTIFLIVVVANAVMMTWLPPIRKNYSTEKRKSVASVLQRMTWFRSSTISQPSGLPRRRRAQRMRSSIDIRLNRDHDADSMLGMSQIVPRISNIQFSSDDEGLTSDEDNCDELNSPMPPVTPKRNSQSSDCPLPSPLAAIQLEDASKPETLPSPPPSRSRRTSSHLDNNSFSNRRSSVATFDRIFCEREDPDNQRLNEAFEFVVDGYSVQGRLEISAVNDIVHKGSPLVRQLAYLFPLQLKVYSRECLHILRVIEVVGLALITGALFCVTGSTTSSNTISQVSSMMQVSALIWTFSRMYPAVPSHYDWFRSTQLIFKYKRFSVSPVFSARLSAVLLVECLWPTLFSLICFPIAGLAGDIRALLNISFLLGANNACYLSLGAAVGMFTQSTPVGMIASTIISQGSILAAGVFVELPSSLAWIRFTSPFYWTIQGLLKSAYKWSDTFDCVGGSGSDVGAYQCFIEYDPLIDQYKQRGIHVAPYNDPSSAEAPLESVMLVVLSVVLHSIMFLRCFFAYYRIKWEEVAPMARRVSSRMP